MKRVTLNSVHPGVSRIVAIKALRGATRDPVSGTAAMGLKESKDIIDRMMEPMLLASADVEVEDIDALREAFTFTVHPSDGTVPKDVVLEFVLDALAWSDPESASRILQLKTYRTLAEHLR